MKEAEPTSKIGFGFKRNYLIYFYGYFAGSVKGTIIHVYVPIYLFNFLNVSRIDLAFIQIFSYSALFSKLLISIYFDKSMGKAWYWMIISSVASIIGFIILIMNLNLLLMYGIFLAINFFFGSILDVAIDKYIVIQSPSKKVKERNALCLNLGSLIGSILPMGMAIFFLTDIYSINSWNEFFFTGIIAILPLIALVLFFKRGQEYKISEQKRITRKDINLKHVALMCIFVFFLYADGLYQYPLEPWALTKLGEENIGLFSMIMIVFIIIMTIGFLIAGTISHKFNRMKLIIVSTFIDGALIAIAPFTQIYVFFILIGGVYFCSGFIIINMISIWIDLSKGNVVYFQLMSLFATVSAAVFVPLGTYLSAIIPTELIIGIAGVLVAASIIPLFLLKHEEKED